MSHSTEQVAVFTNYAEASRIEFDDPLEATQTEREVASHVQRWHLSLQL